MKSADNGTINEPVLHARCILYPNIHPLVLLNPHRASVSIPERGTSFFFMFDLCHTCPFAFNNEPSTDTMDGSTNPSFMKSIPITSILDLMSIDITLNLLSNVLLSGNLSKPHAFITFLLYGMSIEKYWCNTLLLGILSHTLTMKHLTITVGE